MIILLIIKFYTVIKNYSHQNFSMGQYKIFLKLPSLSSLRSRVAFLISSNLSSSSIFYSNKPSLFQTLPDRYPSGTKI